METWNDVREQVLGKIGTAHASDRSLRKGLKEIFKRAEEMDIPFECATGIKISNFRDILSKAHIAAIQRDRQRLEELFEMAAHSNNSDLRIKLETRIRPVIIAKKVDGPSQDLYTITLTRAQLEQIAKSNREQIKIVIKEAENHNN